MAYTAFNIPLLSDIIKNTKLISWYVIVHVIIFYMLSVCPSNAEREIKALHLNYNCKLSVTVHLEYNVDTTLNCFIVHFIYFYLLFCFLYSIFRM